MEYKNKITPNPLNSSGFINNNYKDENYATSDMDGEAHSEKYREINSNSSNGAIITAMERIHEDMYLPGLGELGIALQNITYINERITYVNTFSSQAYYAEPFNMSAKYMSSTLYYNNNIVNENYTNNATIDNIWSIDLNEAYITFSSIKYTEYNIMPMYKYVPTSTYMGGDEHIDTGDTIIEETEEPEIQPVEDEDERYTDSSYFCTNLNYRLSSYMFNYKSDNDISTLSANTYIRFSYIPTFYHHKFWPLQHIKKTITFNYVHDDIDRNDITITSDVDTNVNYKNSISITYNDNGHSSQYSSTYTMEREWYYYNSTSFTLDVKGSWIMYENNVSRGSQIIEFTAEPGQKKFMSGTENWTSSTPHVKGGPWIFNSILSAYINYKDSITIYSKEITPPDATYDVLLKEWWCRNPNNFTVVIEGSLDYYDNGHKNGTLSFSHTAPPGDSQIPGVKGTQINGGPINGHWYFNSLISAYRLETIDYKDYLSIYYNSNTSQISQYSTTSGNVGGYQTIKTIYIKNNSAVTIDADVKFYHTGNYTTTAKIRCNPGNTSTGRSSMWITYSQQGGGSTIGAEEGYFKAEIVSATKVDYDTNLHKKIYDYLINFCFIIPNFNYIDDNGIIFTVGTTKETDIANSNPTINIYDTKIEMVFNCLGKSFTFYPKQDNMMNGCVIFTTEDDMYLNSTMLENSSQRLSVELNMYYKISNNYFNMFSTQYYFDVYELYESGNKKNNYNRKIKFLKINNHKSINTYINYTNLPEINLNSKDENKIINLLYSINSTKVSDEYAGIRVNNLEQKYVSSYSYNGLTYTYNNSENYINTGFGISYISNFYNNGLQDLARPRVMDFSYYYPDGNIDEYSYQGNTNIQITYGQYAPNHIYLRTFNQKDEYGIYNDCILNNLNGNINNPIDNSAIYFSDNMKIYNLPACGAKQYITVLCGPNYPKYYSLFDTHYLFIVNKKRYDITISFDDTSKILCRNKTNITIETGEMKLYYPMMSDLEYYINLSNSSTSSSDSITFQVVDLYQKLTKSSNSSTNVPGADWEDKLMNMTATIYYLYTHQDEIDLTKVDYYNLFNKWGINAFTEQADGSRSCNIKIADYYTLVGRSYLVIIS